MTTSQHTVLCIEKKKEDRAIGEEKSLIGRHNIFITADTVVQGI